MAMADMEWNRLNGVKALIDTGITAIPDLYIQPLEERPDVQDLSHHFDEIPIIDLLELRSDSGQGRDSVIGKLIDASEKWGFFQVVNHGVELQLIQQMIGVAHEFFQLPLEEKMIHYTTDMSAPVRYGTSFNPLKEKVLDWQDHVLHRFLPERREQPHPWPTKPDSYKKIGEEYFDQVTSLAKQLLSGLSEGLGLSSDCLEKSFGKHQAALRLNYYPPCPNPELAIGLSGHSDIGGLTLLVQDIPGLQVKHEGEWMSVNPVPGAIVVNICDQLQIFSNGRLKSAEHRAIVNAERDRVSVALFWDPSSDVKVAPMAAFGPPLYQPCVFGEYVENLFSKRLVGKAWVESQTIDRVSL